MTPVTKTKPLLVSPVGYEEVLRGMATQELIVGDPVVVDAAVTPSASFDTCFKKAASEAFFHGVVLKTAAANTTVEVLINGEMDGFSGLTPGAAYYAEAGVLGTTVPASAVRQVWAISATRIRVSI